MTIDNNRTKDDRTLRYRLYERKYVLPSLILFWHSLFFICIYLDLRRKEYILPVGSSMTQISLESLSETETLSSLDFSQTRLLFFVVRRRRKTFYPENQGLLTGPSIWVFIFRKNPRDYSFRSKLLLDTILYSLSEDESDVVSTTTRDTLLLRRLGVPVSHYGECLGMLRLYKLSVLRFSCYKTSHVPSTQRGPQSPE